MTNSKRQQPVVLMYLSVFSSTGGGQHAMALLVQQLSARGYQVVIVTRPPFHPNHRYCQWISENNVPVIVLPRFAEFVSSRVMTLIAGLMLTLPYVVVRRTSVRAAWRAATSWCGTLIARRERRHLEYVLNTQRQSAARDGRDFILHVWGPASLTPRLLEWGNAESVATIYHEMGEADEAYVKTWHLQSTVESIHRADLVICSSSLVNAEIRTVYGYNGKVLETPFMIEDPGEDWDRFAPSGTGRVTFGAIGRLVEHKRHLHILQAIRNLRDQGLDAGLIIAGSGPMRGQLEQAVADLDIADCVEFTGEFDHVRDVMSRMDVFVLVSVSESQCMPINESMSYGKPCIVARSGGMPDFVAEGETGYIVDIGNISELTDRMRRLMQDDSLRQKLGLQGRARYEQLYQPGAITDQITDAYERLTADRPIHTQRLGYLVECYATFITTEIQQLRQMGARVTIFNAFRPIGGKPLNGLESEGLYFPDRYKGVIQANLLAFIRSPTRYLMLARFLRREQESLRILILAAWFATIVRRQNLRHLHATFGTRTTTLAYVISELTGIAYSFTTHSYDIYLPNPSLKWKTKQSQFMRTISQFNRQYLHERYGLDESRIEVCYLGVDTEQFAPVDQAGSSANPNFRLTSVGSLIPEKGHEYLIAACRILADEGINFRCRIVGDGPLQEQLQQQITDLGLNDRVDLLGRLSHADVSSLLAQTDTFVLACADVREQGEHVDGIPVALMEAMSCGLPVVSTNVSGIPELIENNSCGLLAREKDPSDLAVVLQRLANDPARRTELGKAARQRVDQYFNLSRNTSKLATLFERSHSLHDGEPL